MDEKRKKSKQFYSKPNYKKQKSSMTPGLKGFLCSCNFNEKFCVRESYNLLNKYADLLNPKEETKPEQVSIEDELNEELQQLKSETSKKFQVVESGAKNFLFIKTSLDDPVELAEKIAEDILQTKIQQTRTLIRLVPIEITCKANTQDILLSFENLFEKNFKGEPTTFSIIYNHRNNNSLSKDEVIDAVAKKVGEFGTHKVNLKEPAVIVLIEVVKGFAFLAVLKSFLKFKKFNLHMLAPVSAENNEQVVEDNKEETKTVENLNVESKE